MKDTLITARRKKIELLSLLVCFIVANGVNLYSIIAYKTSFKELFTELGYVLAFTAGLYVMWSIMRIIIYLIKKLFKSKK